MKTNLLTFLIFCTHLSLYSQQERGDIELSFNPTSLLFNEPRLNLNFEKSTGSNSGLNLSLGYGNQKTAQLYLHTNGSNSTAINFLFYEARPEFKYYFPIFTLPVYLSCEVFYLQFKKTTHNDYFTLNDITFNYEKTDYLKTKYGITLIGGLKPYIFDGNYFVEMFGGIGIANRIMNYKNTTPSEQQFNSWTWFDFGSREIGSKIVPNIVIGFRMGFIAKKTSK